MIGDANDRLFAFGRACLDILRQSEGRLILRDGGSLCDSEKDRAKNPETDFGSISINFHDPGG